MESSNQNLNETPPPVPSSLRLPSFFPESIQRLNTPEQRAKLGPFAYYLDVWAKWTDLSGRSRRSEYWYAVLFNILFLIALQIPIMLVSWMNVGLITFVFSLPYIIFALVSIVPGFCVAVRRLHDTGKSGWFLLVGVIPILGLALIYFMCIDSQPGANQYGPNPKGV